MDGVFIGAAVMLPEAQGWRFVSADHRSSGADGCTAPTLDDTRMLARRAFIMHRSAANAPGTPELPNRRFLLNAVRA